MGNDTKRYPAFGRILIHASTCLSLPAADQSAFQI
ncbi:uncharacterized protein CTRU02_202249 [Colletotrichum truncatum]|uniref:Uncharacterized protein n=1 Tax=Colletotrichum truncatum TaxID=5467 RepID=A0ACC3ZKA4_COLTU|nr:uncharacterized protein CTRU02_01409 [Colletotrichum truncatum]KAF6799730.1 hypothetical protein CTRU02_01409 [Colletotrichum truncatum]